MAPNSPEGMVSSPTSSISSWYGFSDVESRTMPSSKRRKISSSCGDYVRIGADGNPSNTCSSEQDTRTRFIPRSSVTESLRRSVKETRLMNPPTKGWSNSLPQPLRHPSGPSSVLEPFRNSKAISVPSYHPSRSTEETARKIQSFNDFSGDESSGNSDADDGTENSSPKPVRGSIPESFADQIKYGPLPSPNDPLRTLGPSRSDKELEPNLDSHFNAGGIGESRIEASETRNVQKLRCRTGGPEINTNESAIIPPLSPLKVGAAAPTSTVLSGTLKAQAKSSSPSAVDKGSLKFLLNPTASSSSVARGDNASIAVIAKESRFSSSREESDGADDALNSSLNRRRPSMPPSEQKFPNQSSASTMSNDYLTASNSMASGTLKRSAHKHAGPSKNSEDLASSPRAILTPDSPSSASPRLEFSEIQDFQENEGPARKKMRSVYETGTTPEISRSFQPPMLLDPCYPDEPDMYQSFTTGPTNISNRSEVDMDQIANAASLKTQAPTVVVITDDSSEESVSSGCEHDDQLSDPPSPEQALEESESKHGKEPNGIYEARQTTAEALSPVRSVVQNPPIDSTPVRALSVVSISDSEVSSTQESIKVSDVSSPTSRPTRNLSEHVKDMLFKPDPEDERVSRRSATRTPVSLTKLSLKPPAVPLEQDPPSSKRIKRKTTGLTSYFFNHESDDRKKRNRRASAGTSTVPVPSTNAEKFGIVQETLWKEPFWLLVAVKLLNKTKGNVAIPAFEQLRSHFQTPEALASASYELVYRIIVHLGFQHQRTSAIINLAQQWLKSPPSKNRQTKVKQYPNLGSYTSRSESQNSRDEDARTVAQGYLEIGHLHGCGRYAYDSWRIFCRDVLRGVADDYNGKNAADANFEPEWKRVQPLDKELIACLKWMWLREGVVWDSTNNEKREATSEELKEARERGLEVTTTSAETENSQANTTEFVVQGRANDVGGGTDYQIAAMDTSEDDGMSGRDRAMGEETELDVSGNTDNANDNGTENIARNVAESEAQVAIINAAQDDADAVVGDLSNNETPDVMMDVAYDAADTTNPTVEGLSNIETHDVADAVVEDLSNHETPEVMTNAAYDVADTNVEDSSNTETRDVADTTVEGSSNIETHDVADAVVEDLSNNETPDVMMDVAYDAADTTSTTVEGLSNIETHDVADAVTEDPSDREASGAMKFAAHDVTKNIIEILSSSDAESCAASEKSAGDATHCMTVDHAEQSNSKDETSSVPIIENRTLRRKSTRTIMPLVHQVRGYSKTQDKQEPAIPDDAIEVASKYNAWSAESAESTEDEIVVNMDRAKRLLSKKANERTKQKRPQKKKAVVWSEVKTPEPLERFSRTSGRRSGRLRRSLK